ncbi:MAG: hypothetical protein LBH51_08915 [Treponema sp.]|jgi:hypothetical protein|nr:hypothetical protein [Treponema sp.]
MRKWLVGLTAVAISLFISCDFVSESWGQGFARDPGTIQVTAGNVEDLLRDARGDSETSRAILDKIAEKLKNNPNPDPTLQKAAVIAANQAAGLGSVIMNNLDVLLDENIPSEETLKKLLEKIEADIKKNDLPGISKSIVESLPVGRDSDGMPVFTKKFESGDADLTILAIALILAESENSGGFDNYIKSWSDGSKKIDGTVEGLSDSELVIAAAANEVMSNPDGELGKMIESLLGSD